MGRYRATGGSIVRHRERGGQTNPSCDVLLQRNISYHSRWAFLQIDEKRRTCRGILDSASKNGRVRLTRPVYKYVRPYHQYLIVQLSSGT